MESNGCLPVLGSQPAGDVSHKAGSRSPLLSARPSCDGNCAESALMVESNGSLLPGL